MLEQLKYVNHLGEVSNIIISCCSSLHFDIGNNGIYKRGWNIEEDSNLFSGAYNKSHHM